MKKKLVLEAFYIRRFDTYVVRVKEQTHRKGGFGEKGSKFFSSSSSIILNSAIFPEYDPTLSVPVVYVRGDNKDWDNFPFVLPTNKIEDLRSIVREYNKQFSDGDVPPENEFETIE